MPHPINNDNINAGKNVIRAGIPNITSITPIIEIIRMIILFI